MIKKIINIQKVGRFNHFCGRSNELSFSKNTFIFGKNTQGKSTFTAILRSMASGNADFIIGRKSFDTITNQNVVIETDDGQKIFKDTIWNGALDIKIFDSLYITENIYSDDYLDENKRNKIATIILGKEGKRLEKEYKDSKQKLDENSKAKTDITNQYNRTFDKSIFDFQSFRKKEENPSIDNDISIINANLKAVKNQQSIKSLLERLSSYLNKLDNIDTAKICETLEVKQKEIKATEEELNDNYEEETFIKHRALCINAVFSATSFLEALINELFMDSKDNRAGLVRDITDEQIKALSEMWDLGIPRTANYNILEKYQIALTLLKKGKINLGEDPAQSVSLIIKLRNSLTHYEPEWISTSSDDEELIKIHKMEKLLRGRFELNNFTGKENPFFPDKCLSYGLVNGIIRKVIDFSDLFFIKIGIIPPYEKVRFKIEKML